RRNGVRSWPPRAPCPRPRRPAAAGPGRAAGRLWPGTILFPGPLSPSCRGTSGPVVAPLVVRNEGAAARAVNFPGLALAQFVFGMGDAAGAQLIFQEGGLLFEFLPRLVLIGGGHSGQFGICHGVLLAMCISG